MRYDNGEAQEEARWRQWEVKFAGHFAGEGCQPIAVENVVEYLAGALSAPECSHGTFDIGGSETLRYRGIIRIIAEEFGLPGRWIMPRLGISDRTEDPQHPLKSHPSELHTYHGVAEI